MTGQRPVQPARIVVIGITGNLARRYIVPAIVSLYEAHRIAEDIEIIGVGRSAIDDTGLRSHLRTGVAHSLKDSAAFGRIRYVRAEVDDAQALAAVLRADGPVVIYLALPAHVFEAAVRAIGSAAPALGTRIVVEKPFGDGLASARRLNDLLHDAFPEESVFRIDHFLHKQTVQNILGLRFANRVFEPLWNREHVERIEIRWDERVALDGRAAYYDRAGALRDMVQNHLLQLAALVGMEPPATMSARDLRDRKVEFLRAVRRLAVEEVRDTTVRARYTAGQIDEQRELPAYIDEEGVDPARATETYAKVILHVDNWRWADVPFILRTGKALQTDRREIVVTFRDVPHLAFGTAFQPVANRLRLELDPDRLALDLNVNGRGDPFDLEELELTAELAPEALPTYARVLLAVLDGDPVFSIRDDEAEESWRIVEPILKAWSADLVPMVDYPAGSTGPVESHLGAPLYSRRSTKVCQSPQRVTRKRDP